MAEAGVDELALLWVLNLSDGRHRCSTSRERRANRSPGIRRAADLLVREGLLKDAARTAPLLHRPTAHGRVPLNAPGGTR